MIHKAYLLYVHQLEKVISSRDVYFSDECLDLKERDQDLCFSSEMNNLYELDDDDQDVTEPSLSLRHLISLISSSPV